MPNGHNNGDRPVGFPRRPAAVVRRPETLPVTDRARWALINSEGDVLAGMTFAQAVAHDPLRIEALIHQRIHQEFGRLLGDYPDEQMGFAAYQLRNQTLLNVHGRITALNIADSMEANWQDYSVLMQRAAFMAARGDPMAIEYIGRLQQGSEDLQRAFREAAGIARRAARISTSEEDNEGWMRMAAVVENMGRFVQDQLMLPVRGRRPALGQRPAPAPPRPEPVMRYLPVPDEPDEPEEVLLYRWGDGFTLSRSTEYETSDELAYLYTAPDGEIRIELWWSKDVTGGAGHPARVELPGVLIPATNIDKGRVWFVLQRVLGWTGPVLQDILRGLAGADTRAAAMIGTPVVRPGRMKVPLAELL